MVQGQKVHQIRSGDHHFIDITIASTEGRFFVRPYKFGANGWRDAFLKNPAGQMKITDVIIDIDGVIPDDLDTINPKINEAYKKLLGMMYSAMRMTFDAQKHEALTLELIPKNLND